MPIDPYSPCPGGTGKKIKFCCSELLSELDKIQRMLEGEQRAGCLDHIEALETKYPERACLMSIKAMLQAQLGQQEKAEATLSAFRKKYPDNPVALAEQATLKASTEGGIAAISVLQDALEKCDEQVPPQVYDAIGLVAQVLISDGQLIPGRAHLVLQLGIGGTQDKRPLELLMRLNGSPSVPMLAKQDFPLSQPPADALWKGAFTTAIEPAMRGAWRLAADQLTALAAQVGDWPAIWHNIAVLRMWLSDTPQAIEAWRKYAAAPIPIDDAVEAEAVAQSLDPQSVDLIDVLSIEFAVADSEVVLAHLAAHRRAVSMPIDLGQVGAEDQPPPKAAYWLLNQAAPDSGREITAQQVPQVVGQAFVYGKQTDRDARLELATYRTQLADAQAALAEICGDALGPAGAEQVSTQIPALQHALTLSWRFPDDTPPERRLELANSQRRELLLERWPEMPQNVFGGKSANQIAGQDDQRIKLLAAILLLEMATDRVAPEVDFDALRGKVGCEAQQPIDPGQVSLAELPLLRLARVEVNKLSDEDLVDLYRRANHYRHIAALRKLAHEAIARPGLEKQLDKAEVYGLLAQIEPDTQQAIAYLDQARETAEKTGKSTAPWDLAELAMRISRGDAAEADRLLHHIRDQHLREPGVAQALFEILAEAGIIGPDGKPTAAAPPPEAAGLGVPGAAPADAGKIWTPDSDAPTAGKKSALWTPDDG